MSSTPQPPRQPEPIVNQHYQPAQGAIPIDRLKRVGIAVGVLFLAIFTLWGIFHKSPAPGSSQKPSRITLTSPAQVDSQQAELQREMQEAERAKQEAELAKQRAMHGGGSNEGPRNAQVDPESQLRAQMRLDDIRRQHQAAYASTVAFAPTGTHPEASNTTPAAPPSGQPPQQQPAAESKAPQLPVDARRT